MGLGQRIAPLLNGLLRYATLLLGNERVAEIAVRRALESVVAERARFRDIADVPDLELELYRAFHVANAAYSGPTRVLASSDALATAAARLSTLRWEERQAVLLTAMEGFDPEDAAYILGYSSGEVAALSESAIQNIMEQLPKDVLIVEDEPVIAMDLETTVRDLGFNVTRVASTRDEAVAAAKAQLPGLVLMDIRLADDSSGVDAAFEISRLGIVPIIFITAFPERLLTGERPEPTFLITKPFKRSTVKAAVIQAVFSGGVSRVVDPFVVNEPPVGADLPVPHDAVAPRRSPVDARVVGSQIRLVDNSPAETRIDPAAVDAARRVHHRTARRLCAALAGSNVGPGFNARLEAVRRVLSRKLSAERTLQLALEVRGLEAMMPAIAERLDDVTVADVATFVDDLGDLAKQFPAYRAFLDEALAFDPAAPAALEAAASLAEIVETAGDDLVQPELQRAVRDVRLHAQETPGRLADLALLRTVGNVFRAVGRSFNRRLAGTRKVAADTFDQTTGKAVGQGLSWLVVGGSVGGLLTALASAFPSEFTFVQHLLRLARLFL